MSPEVDSPATLDDAQAALIEMLTKRPARGDETAGWTVTATGHDVQDVYDAGRARHERLVSFTLVTGDGESVTFTATITED